MNQFGTLTPEIIEELKRVANVIADDRDALENYASDSAGVCWGHMPDAVVRPVST